ncbi:hypothetical protein VTK26DRAFT_4439 [Humicola hyalothermophila]
MDLYSTQKKELPEVMKIMKDVHGFVASAKMYKKHLRLWGVKKNIPASEMIPMLKIEGRRRNENKETRFAFCGQPVEPKKMRRSAKRYKLTISHGANGGLDDEPVKTPPGVTYSTPEPDPSAGAAPPVPHPYPGSENKEAEAPVAKTTDTSGGFDLRESPSSRAIPWAPSTSAPWPAGVVYSVTQPISPIPVMDDLFISSAFSRPQIPDVSHEFPRYTMENSLSPDPWLEPANDTNGDVSQMPANRTTAWMCVSPPPQHTVHAYDYNSEHMTRSLTAMPDNLGSSDQGQAINTGRSALDHTPLHNAVVDNNLGLAKALLEAGANANCAARGGMTPLHYASFQRNVEMVRLLKSYGANLDALTDKGRSVLFFAARGEASLESSDMLCYERHSLISQGVLTDEATMGVIDALYNFAAGWARLLRSLDLADKDGMTPLMAAAEGGFEQTVIMFLQRGARPDVRDHAGNTALKYAASANHRPLVRLLLEADARVEARDLSHLLKLANNNLCDGWRNGCQNFHSVLIAEEMVRLCHERQMLERLTRLAELKRKAGVLELLRGVMAQLGIEDGSQGVVGGG